VQYCKTNQIADIHFAIPRLLGPIICLLLSTLGFAPIEAVTDHMDLQVGDLLTVRT